MRASVIPAYPYSIYRDDDKISVFFQGFNKVSQDYIDSFNSLNLPIYSQKIGPFLDWVGNNIYGISRPVFPVGHESISGEINSAEINSAEINALVKKYPKNFVLASDDVYHRVITWHHWKGDGDVFNIRTLKRRIMRFLTNGRVDQTYQISVSFAPVNQVNITIYNNGRIPLRPSSVVNDGELNASALNEIRARQVSLVKFDLADIFKSAVLSGVLELPFQYQYIVNII